MAKKEKDKVEVQEQKKSKGIFGWLAPKDDVKPKSVKKLPARLQVKVLKNSKPKPKKEPKP